MALRNLAPMIATIDTRSAQPIEHKANPFYLSPAWRNLIAAIVKARGAICEDARHDPGKPRKASRIFGDHILELKDGGAPLDERNVMLRCGACHTRKTIEERARRMARRSSSTSSESSI